MKKKLMYVVSEIDKSLHFEWIAPPLAKKYDLKFILIGKRETHLSAFLKAHGIPFFEFDYQGSKSLPSIWIGVFRTLQKEKPHILHTHLWIANLIGLTTGWVARIPKRVYTRHHAMVHYDEHPSGRKWDRLCNALATHIIAISKSVQNILVDRDRANPAKVQVIPHGFDLPYFANVEAVRVEKIRERYALRQQKPIVGIIARYMEWKGIQFIIPAFHKLKSQYPQAHLVLANAHGRYGEVIQPMLTNLPKGSFTEIKFENDLAALYKVFDVFVHAPIDPHSEAFGQTYIEPLIAGIPCVFTLSGIAREMAEDGKNACVVSFKNSDEIYAAMVKIIEDQSFRENLIRQGRETARQYSLENYLTHLQHLYDTNE